MATLTRGGDTVVITVGSDVFTTNGNSHSLDVPAAIIGGSTLLPIRAVLESVGYELDWDENTSTVLISPPSAIVITAKIEALIRLNVGTDFTVLEQVHFSLTDERRIRWQFLELNEPLEPDDFMGTEAWDIFGTQLGDVIVTDTVGRAPSLLIDVGSWASGYRAYSRRPLYTLPPIEITAEMEAEIRRILGTDFTVLEQVHSFVRGEGRHTRWQFLDLSQPLNLDNFQSNEIGDIFGTQLGDVIIGKTDGGLPFLLIDADDSHVNIWTRSYFSRRPLIAF